jgi:hypothetical protein
MRLPRVRFTVRRMMVAVAVIAILIEGVSLWQRAALYRWKVRHHAMMERSSVIAVVEGPKAADNAELARLSEVWSTYHAAMKQKYEYAVTRPWIYVPPDPPQPFPLSEPGRRVDLHFAY